MSKQTSLAMVAVFAGVMLAAARIQAAEYGFYNISANSVLDAAIGEAQLRVQISDPGGGQILFTFKNLGPAASSITDVYFDDGNNDFSPLASLATIANGPGVNFSSGASPSNLPAHNNVSPSFSANFDLDSNAPTQPNGVNPGEQLGLTFNLAGGTSYADLIDELEAATLRIGIHIQGFADGNSEAFVNNIKPVPTPGALILAVVGFGLVIRLRKSLSRGLKPAAQ